MKTRAAFDRAIRRAGRTDRKIEFFGALLASEIGPDSTLTVVGGSAICVYTDGEYVSADIDGVGDKERIIRVLATWGFQQEGKYWVRPDLALFIDVNRAAFTSASPFSRVILTPYGPVRLGAIEDVMVRRLIYAKRPATNAGITRIYIGQAAKLVARYGDELDWKFIESEVRYEDVEDVYREMRNRALRARDGPKLAGRNRRRVE